MNKLTKIPGFLWRTLTEVPGWPGAPLPRRVRRALPVAIPFLLLLVLVLLQFLVISPYREATALKYAPFAQLDSEVQSLRLAYSDQRAQDVAIAAKAAQEGLITTDAEFAELGERLKRQTQEDWTLKILASDPADPASPEAVFRPQTLRVTLKPTPGNQKPLAALLALVEALSKDEKRIELTRLNIRADEVGWQGVDLHLQVARPLLHEKAAQ